MLKKKYANIIFIQNSQDFDSYTDSSGNSGVDAFFNASDKEKFDYLAQWDEGEYHDISDIEPVALIINSEIHADYILTYDYNLQYAGLTKIIYCDE